MEGIFSAEIPVSFVLAMSCYILAFEPRELLSLAACIAVHESGHLISVLLFKARDIRLKPGLFGLEISYSPLSLGYVGQLISSLAGPAAGMILCLVLRSFPDTAAHSFMAACSLALSLINLLPVSFLDGGEAVCSAVRAAADSSTAYRAAFIMDIISLPLLCTVGTVLSVENADASYAVLPFCLLISYCENEKNVL